MQPLLKEARKAINAKDFSLACEMYRQLLELGGSIDPIDIKLRLAWCSDRAGYQNDACGLYEEIIQYYHEQGEVTAEKSLQEILDKLRKPKEMTSAIDFEALAMADRARLMKQLQHIGEDRVLAAGKVLFHLGDIPKNLWLLQKGTLRQEGPACKKSDEIISATDAKFVLCGEESIFTLQRREATVSAETAVSLLEIPFERIHNLRKQSVDFDVAMEHLMRERWAAQILSHHPIFQRVNDVDRVRISHLFEAVEMHVGECLMRRQDEHAAAYLVQEGCMFLLHEHYTGQHEPVEGEPKEGELLASVLPGSFIHLGGLLRGYESPCRIVAITPVRLLRLSQDAFEIISSRRPWMVPALLRLVRLPVNEQVAQPHEKNLWDTNHDIELRQVAKDDEYD